MHHTAPSAARCSADDSGWLELREVLADRIVAETDAVACTELVPRLLERRQALVEQREMLGQVAEGAEAEMAWIDGMVERCEAQGERRR